MTTNIDTLMCNIEKDIKLTNDDEKLLSDLTENFIANQLDEIKNVKMNNVYKNINKTLVLICDKIAEKFDIDKNVMNEIIESELCSINLRYDNEKKESNSISNMSENEDSLSEVEEKDEEEEEEEVDIKLCQVFIQKKGCICGRLKKEGTNYCGYHKNHNQ